MYPATAAHSSPMSVRHGIAAGVDVARPEADDHVGRGCAERRRQRFAADDAARYGDPFGDDLGGDALDRLLACGIDRQQQHFVGLRQRLGELAVEVARAGVEVRLEDRRHAPAGKHPPHRGERGGQFARMVGIVVHVDLPRGIDIEFEAAFDPLEGRQRTPQSLCVERPSFGAGGAPHRRDGRDGVFDVDPAGDPQRAITPDGVTRS